MHELVQVALVGTSRHSRALTAETDHPVDALRGAWDGDDLAHSLLLRAGAMAVCNQSGQVARTDVPAISPAPADHAAACSAKLIDLLQNALAAGPNDDLLLEFLRAMHDGRLFLPPQLLPQALSRTDAEVREALLPVLGERGTWLSEFNPDWQWATAAAASLSSQDAQVLQSVWEDGILAERRRVLAELRRSDPARAREWLAAVMNEEKADARAALLETFEHGLSPSDEAFLEERLDDRSEQVRRLAARMLAQISGTALAARIRERADAMLTADKAGLLRRRLKLCCDPPEEIDKAWERDGIARKPPGGVGKRAFWAQSVFSLVPPSHWTEHFKSDPETLLKAIEKDNFADAVLVGWTQAAALFASFDPQTAPWLPALADHWIGLTGDRRSDAFSHLASLIAAMPKASAEAVVLKLLDGAQTERGLHALNVLEQLPRPWTADVGLPFLAQARAILMRFNDNRAYRWAGSLALAAKALPRETFEAALESWEVKESTSDQMVIRETERFTETIQMRRRFFSEIEAARNRKA